MAPTTDERPLNAQEAFLKQQREQRARGDKPAPLPDEIETGPNAVLGYDTDDAGESSVHGVINSPYLKDRIAKGQRIAPPTPGLGDTAGRRVVDRGHTAAAETALAVDAASPAEDADAAAGDGGEPAKDGEQATDGQPGGDVKDGATQSQAAAGDKAETASVEGHPTKPAKR